jgi:hypothetical protein
MSVIRWQINASKWLFPVVLSMLLMLSGCGITSQVTNPLSPGSEKVAPVPPPESTVEVAPVNPPIAAIAPSPEVKELPATEPTDIPDPQPEEASKLATTDNSTDSSPLTELLQGESLEQ